MTRVRISNERLNSYGSRVLTSGMDVSQYERNPVLLYMHERGHVIGCVKDLKVDGSEVTGELAFDEASELSRQCKKQWEFGSLKMVSVGIDILATSEEPEDLVPGQTAPTIVKSKLFEVSLVDIGANDDAIVLRRQDSSGRWQTLRKDDNFVLTPNSNKDMDIKKIISPLGLSADAGEEAVLAAVTNLKKEASAAGELRQELATLRAARIGELVDGAIASKKIGADKRDQFVKLGTQIGAEELAKTFAAMSPRVKASELLEYAGADGHAVGTWTKLSDVPETELLKLRHDNPERYKQLYKAEYGIECEIED